MKIFENKNKELNLEILIDTRMLLCANSGGGKSYGARRIMEESHEKGMMSIIFDIEGEFRTLREKYEYLLIGPNGDIPLNPKVADKLPRKILEMNVPVIIDISDLKMRERIRYVKEFLEALMELPREFWKPLLLFLDEAHMFCGQQEKQDSVHAVIDLMTRGRKRGFCGILMTQRIAKLHKDAAAETNNYLVGRIGLDIDMKRAAEILGFTTKEQMLSLRDLEPGEFFGFGPGLSKSVEKLKINECKTTHPKRGTALKVEINPPTKNVMEALSKLKELPEEVARELKDLNELKTENRILKVELAKKPKEVVREEKIIEVTDIEALKKAYERGAKDMDKKYDSIIMALKSNGIFVERAIQKLLIDGGKILESKSFSLVTDKPRIIIPEFQSSRKIMSKSPQLNARVKESEELHKKNSSEEIQDSGRIWGTEAPIMPDNLDFKLDLCARKIYSFLAQYSERSFSKTQVGVFTGYSNSSGGFNNALGKLRSMGLIEGSGDNLKVREINSYIIGQFDFSKEAIISKLGKCEKEIYNFLLENPEEEFSKEELASNTPSNYSANSGGFNNSLGRLNTFGLIKKNNGRIKLNPELLEI